jgi:beta-phosphoglucomutase-like phosphatase (HAD superfamily)
MYRNVRRGIFFELDGTLADSHVAMRGAFANFAATLGREVSDAEFVAINGPPAAIAIAVLKRDWALPQKLHELIQLYDKLADAAFHDVAPAPGAAATLEAAFAQGFKVGIVTSTGAARSRRWLAAAGLARFVDVVIGGDEVCLGKPDAEPYLVALARSGCAREASIAVENSAQGAKSALAARLRVFGFAPEGRALVEWPEPVRLIGALDELMPEVTRPRFRRAGNAA